MCRLRYVTILTYLLKLILKQPLFFLAFLQGSACTNLNQHLAALLPDQHNFTALWITCSPCACQDCEIGHSWCPENTKAVLARYCSLRASKLDVNFDKKVCWSCRFWLKAESSCLSNVVNSCKKKRWEKRNKWFNIHTIQQVLLFCPIMHFICTVLIWKATKSVN